MIDALELYVESASLDPAATFFWICDFCVRQAADDDSTAPDVVRSGEMIREIGHTVLYLEGWSPSPPALTRSWILWELFNSADPGVTFGVAMTKREQARFLVALEEGTAASITDSIDAEASEATTPSHRAAILAAVEEPHLRINSTVGQLLRGWLAEKGRAAVRDGSCDMVSFHLPVAVAGLLGQQGQVFEARAILEQVVKERVDVLGLHDEGTLVAKEALAVFLHDQGELKDSIKLYRQVVKGQENRLEPTNPDLLSAQTNLAVMLREQGELERARDLLEDVLEARKESLGLNHVDTLDSMMSLATLMGEQGGYSDGGEARMLLEDTVNGYELVFGARHQRTLNAELRLGLAMRENGDLDEAADLLEVVFESSKVELGPAHAHTLTAQLSLASLLALQGRRDESVEALFETVCTTRRETLGMLHDQTLAATSQHAAFLLASGRLDDACVMYERVVHGREEALGEEHEVRLGTECEGSICMLRMNACVAAIHCPFRYMYQHWYMVHLA
mmetsp:Transcript_32093/g.74083  ORF Transcript_32093/g.74083 Transcript_32093/m.74083 type:complete len:508 (-) Transcript_32093:596-2119(-)